MKTGVDPSYELENWTASSFFIKGCHSTASGGDLSIASRSPFSLTFSALVTCLSPLGGIWSELVPTEVGEEDTILVTL